MAILDPNDASTSNAIIPMIDPRVKGGKSMVVPDPNDTPTQDAIISKKSCKKKGRVPAMAILAASPRINSDAAPPVSMNHVHTDIPSKSAQSDTEYLHLDDIHEDSSGHMNFPDRE
jgi:hypothetical protein